MKQVLRNQIKDNLGIFLAKDERKRCQKCLYHNPQKICQIHMIKTKIDETCSSYKIRRRSSVYRGGGVSPK